MPPLTRTPARGVRELCDRRGYEVVGIAEDLDVSAGSTSPFDRPQLGDWLSNRLGEFDAIVFFRVDRIVRRLFDLADIIRWGRDHSVTLVSATESHFDLSTEFGETGSMPACWKTISLGSYWSEITWGPTTARVLTAQSLRVVRR
jgi:DNA invertase Pin-like site-specific DNA recombinase